MAWLTGWSYLNVLLDLLVLLLRGKELSLREGFPQRLLGHEGLQLQQGRHSAVLANETGAIRIKVDCGKIHKEKKRKEKRRSLVLGKTKENVCDTGPRKSLEY